MILSVVFWLKTELHWHRTKILYISYLHKPRTRGHQITSGPLVILIPEFLALEELQSPRNVACQQDLLGDAFVGGRMNLLGHSTNGLVSGKSSFSFYLVTFSVVRMFLEKTN